MGLVSYLQTSQPSAAVPVSESPQTSQQDVLTQARTEVTYNNAGQEPPQPGRTSIMPHVQGGFVVWLVIVVLLWCAFALYNRSQNRGRSIEVKVTEKEGAAA